MNMPHPLNFPQSPSHSHLPHHLAECYGGVVGDNLVLRPVDQKGRRGVGATTEMGERGDGGDEVGGRRAGPRFAV